MNSKQAKERQEIENVLSIMYDDIYLLIDKMDKEMETFKPPYNLCFMKVVWLRYVINMLKLEKMLTMSGISSMKGYEYIDYLANTSKYLSKEDIIEVRIMAIDLAIEACETNIENIREGCDASQYGAVKHPGKFFISFE